ncbi:isochorismatase family protein, partial [Photobacterium leiognathi]|uniref:isochorismatase family protein n=1 Tax=Photobacterium leiognathi TaxID=553611 RepID=UPI002738D42D
YASFSCRWVFSKKQDDRTLVFAFIVKRFRVFRAPLQLEQRGLLADLWGPGMRTCEEDRQVINELTPQSNDIILTKWRYSAFFNSELEEILSAHGCDTLLITGLYASIGIQATAIDAFTRDIRPIVVADATADFTKLSHQQALNYMSDTCAKVISILDFDNYE